MIFDFFSVQLVNHMNSMLLNFKIFIPNFYNLITQKLKKTEIFSII